MSDLDQLAQPLPKLARLPPELYVPARRAAMSSRSLRPSSSCWSSASVNCLPNTLAASMGSFVAPFFLP